MTPQMRMVAVLSLFLIVTLYLSVMVDSTVTKTTYVGYPPECVLEYLSGSGMGKVRPTVSEVKPVFRFDGNETHGPLVGLLLADEVPVLMNSSSIVQSIFMFSHISHGKITSEIQVSPFGAIWKHLATQTIEVHRTSINNNNSNNKLKKSCIDVLDSGSGTMVVNKVRVKVPRFTSPIVAKIISSNHSSILLRLSAEVADFVKRLRIRKRRFLRNKFKRIESEKGKPSINYTKRAVSKSQWLKNEKFNAYKSLGSKYGWPILSPGARKGSSLTKPFSSGGVVWQFDNKNQMLVVREFPAGGDWWRSSILQNEETGKQTINTADRK